MERGVSVKLRAAAGVVLRLWLGVTVAFAGTAHAENRLLLLVGAKSPVQELSSVEIHRLFLGLTVIVANRPLHALRNESDELMERVFFQNIVSMSEAAYDRRMLAMTLQQGRTAPPVIRGTKAVLDALAADPDAVSFAWSDDVGRDPRVKALRVLWHP